MKKLICSITFVAAVLFLVDRAGGKVMWWVNQQTHDVSGPKIKYLANDVHEDIILMGTSRCNEHYVPSILSDSLGMSVYNGGIDASKNVYAQYIMLNHILMHHRPQIIGLELSTADFLVQDDSFGAVSFFAPYFGRSAAADSLFREAGSYWHYRLSHLYRYNAKATSNIAGLLYNRSEDVENGYLPIPKPPRFPDVLEPADFQYSCDSLKLGYLRRFIGRCRAQGIMLVFMISPKYVVADPEEYAVLRRLAAEHGVPLFDYHTPGLYQDHPEYFKDNAHLWDKGARLFSAVFAHDLKGYLDSIAAE